MGALSLLSDAGRVMGPAFLVSVAYLDPGNWATAIEAGSRFGYRLVWVVVASNLVAILLQTLSARLGIVTGKHLAQVCRESYPPAVIWIVWATCEISIVALDLTMLLGTAVGLNLLLDWPLLPCILLTGLDVVLLLLLVPHKGAIKKSEALTVCLLAVVVACFLVDLIISKPPVSKLVGGLYPTMGREHLYTAVSLLGANVMPHSFYLHSALVSDQARLAAGSVRISPSILSRLCFLNFCDIGCALAVALVVNVSVLLVSAATFHSRGITVETLQDAHDVMERTLSSNMAPHAFGMALLCAGQLSTFTGTISGQVVLQGFLNVHISTWARRLITRSAAIIPAAVLQYMWGDRATYKFLLIAQVALALQLPVTLVPMIKATSSRKWMGSFRNSWLLAFCAWSALGLIFVANLLLLISQMVTGVEGQTPEVLAANLLDQGQDLDSAWLGLEPDGPMDLFLDEVQAMAWHNPLRFMGLLMLVVAGAAFLALQLWMIITPLPGPAGSDGRTKGPHGALMPSMQLQSAEGAEDEDFDNPPLHRGRRSFHRVKQRTSGEGGEDDEEEEALESWYQGPPDSPRRPKVDEEQALLPQQGEGDYAIQLAASAPYNPAFAAETDYRGVAYEESDRAVSGLVGGQQSNRGGGHVAHGGTLHPPPLAHDSSHSNYSGRPRWQPQQQHSGQQGLGQQQYQQQDLFNPTSSTHHPSSHSPFPLLPSQPPITRHPLSASHAMPPNQSSYTHARHAPQHHQSHHHSQSQHQQYTHTSNPLHSHSQHHSHSQQHQIYQSQHHYQSQQHNIPGTSSTQHHHAGQSDRHTAPQLLQASGGGQRAAGLSRSARRQVAACLEDFFGNYYNAHGQYHSPSRQPCSPSPLLCHHTHMTHLCTACAQTLYMEVRDCLKALEVLEAAANGLLPDSDAVMDFLEHTPLSSPSNPAATPAFAWHEAVVACLRLDDPVGCARLVTCLYSSKLDNSRVLASVPLDSAPLDQTLGRSHHPQAAGASHTPSQPQPNRRGSEGGTGAEDAGNSCLPVLMAAEPRRALLAQIGRMIGFEQPPAMNQWCLVGPASFLSFGLWSLSLLVSLCQNEARPELWGRYAMVLNKQQGLLRDSCLEVASSSAPGAYYPPHISGVHTNILATSEGGVTEGEAYAQAPHTLPSHEYQPLHQHQHQQHSHQQQQYQQHQQQPSSSALTPLPSTATRLESRHLAALRGELARQLQVLEIALADRRGPPGTAAGEVAFPKGKEIMQSVIKRLRRRLGQPVR